jgi:hypothetical protein
MLKYNDYTTTDEWHFSSNFKDANVPALTRIDNSKITKERLGLEDFLGIR